MRSIQITRHARNRMRRHRISEEVIHETLRAPAASPLYELAGPRVYTYQELLRTIAASAGTRPFLVPFPFSLWHIIGYVAEALPSPPLTRNQVELMGQDKDRKSVV